jgi:hypothetical protein
MKLNCRPGDLAVIVRSTAGNEGKIVRCLQLVMAAGPFGFGPRWITDPPVLSSWNRPVPPLDACLRHLRDSDGEDEMLRLAGRPVGEPQAA